MPRLKRDHPLRIFFISGLITLLSLAAIGGYLGPSALFIATVLILVEVTFSFENAIINAKVLSTVSEFWRKIFITVGILIAVVGMRLVFPIVIVAITAGLPMDQVISLTINNPDKYAHELEEAHVPIAAFGGMFLLMLCLHFFFDSNRKVHWINIIEKPMQDMSRWWLYSAVSFAILVFISMLPGNPAPNETFMGGLLGLVTYVAMRGLTHFFSRHQSTHKGAALKTGAAGFTAFLYLEVLDASFSFDGVIEAFAVTKDVLLIAIGLGIGALWVRSLTIFMVEHRVLHAYRFLEHGAHYTIGVLATVMLTGIFFDVPEIAAGVVGLMIVGASIISSLRASKQSKNLPLA